MIESVKKYLSAFSAGSWPELRSILGPECIYEDMTTHRRSVGAEACLAALQRWKIAFPDLRASLARSYAAGDRLCCEVEWSGTHNGSLEHNFGAVAPTRRPVRIKSVNLFVVRDGKINEICSYFDMLSVLTQLGVSPSFEHREHGASPHLVRP